MLETQLPAKRCFWPLIVVLTIVGLTARAATADQVDCNARCTFPAGEVTLDEFLEVDANTGKVLEGSVNFPREARVQVIFRYKNPFRYKYSYEVDTRLVEEGTIAEALKGFLLPAEVASALLNEPGDEEEAAEAAAAEDVAQICTDLDDDFGTAYSDLASELQRITVAEADVQSALKELQGHVRDYGSFITAIQNAPSDIGECQRICSQAVELEPKLLSLSKRTTFKARRAVLNKKVEEAPGRTATISETLSGAHEEYLEGKKGELGETSAEYEELLEECSDRLKDFKTLKGAVLKAVAGKPEAYKKAADAFQEKQEEYEGNLKKIRTVLKDPSAFVETYYLPSHREPVEHTLVIVREDLFGQKTDDKYPEKRIPLERTIQVGRNRFSISGGFAFSFIHQETFARQPGPVPDGMGGTKTGDVFGIEEESDEQVGLVGQLNARLGTWRLSERVKPGIAWSTGISIGTSEGTTDVGYYTGPSLALLEDKFFITIAYHRQKVSELASGFMVGSPVPDDLQGEIPIKNKTESGVLVIFTYRIR